MIKKQPAHIRVISLLRFTPCFFISSFLFGCFFLCFTICVFSFSFPAVILLHLFNDLAVFCFLSGLRFLCSPLTMLIPGGSDIGLFQRLLVLVSMLSDSTFDILDFVMAIHGLITAKPCPCDILKYGKGGMISCVIP